MMSMGMGNSPFGGPAATPSGKGGGMPPGLKAAMARRMQGKRKAASGNSGGGAHPGFAAVQANIAKKGGYSNKVAGAILASASRKASPAAKRANPRLKRV